MLLKSDGGDKDGFTWVLCTQWVVPPLRNTGLGESTAFLVSGELVELRWGELYNSFLKENDGSAALRNFREYLVRYEPVRAQTV